MDKISNRSHLAVAGTGDVSIECLVGMAAARDSSGDCRLSGWALHARNKKVLVRGAKPDSTQAGNPGDLGRRPWIGHLGDGSDPLACHDCADVYGVARILPVVVGQQLAKASVTTHER